MSLVFNLLALIWKTNTVYRLKETFLPPIVKINTNPNDHKTWVFPYVARITYFSQYNFTSNPSNPDRRECDSGIVLNYENGSINLR